MSTLPPLFGQYFGMKARHPEAILLARVGDFYEAYGTDAEVIARLLSITLTSKEAGGERIPMAGVPHHALDGYLAKLVAQQRVVALAEQLEAPVPNRLTRRDVVRIVTPGTLIEEHLLDRARNNYLAAITGLGDALAVAHADLSTGYAAATAYSGPASLDDVVAELARLEPAEVVADVSADVRDAITEAFPGVRVGSSALAAVETRERPQAQGFSLDESLAMHRALDALGAFARRVGVAHSGASLRSPEFYRSRAFLVLDAQARKHLELTKTQGANPRATLLRTLDRCKTAMGSRLLARWILSPLVDRRAIEVRADRVESLVGNYPGRARMQELLHEALDLERLAQKVRFRKALPRDLASLRRTLLLVEPLREVLEPPLHALGDAMVDPGKALGMLQKRLVDEPPIALSDGGVIRPEASAEIAECVALRAEAREQLAALEERERRRTGIKQLKVKYASAFGYSIEVSKSNLALVPPDYVRRQTLTSGERFVTPELKELEIAIASAESRQRRLEEALYEELVATLAEQVDEFLSTAGAMAELDVYCSLAEVAGERGYRRPAFLDESRIDVRDGRHPVMEAMVDVAFVPNDVHLGERADRFLLLTGPNMGGKSTFLRQTALLVVLAQMGSFVPAAEMSLGPVDRIFTRIGAGDDLASGQSTFYVEMAEASNILRSCARRSLLLIDEVGRGTGTADGLSIAQAICEYLLGLEESAPLVLFATHFHELTTLGDRWPLVANYHVTAVENTARFGAPVFSHRVLPGSTSRSFGIEVARMAGLPSGVIDRAREIAAVLASEPTVEALAPLRGRLARPGAEETQLPLAF
ncbi:MAG: DNA mismatch repair protein MutS [Candidatus Eremiobacteraeota bacterium]|nr:DNA mismatch repair protein MutS [Candidatus Eremiobacteraeota bacterium]